MSAQTYLETTPIYELTRYAGRGDYQKDAVQFTGTARKHPYDPNKLLLIPPPFVPRTTIYEFRIADILHVEETSNIVSEDGESLPTVELWIKRGSFGVTMQPFEVGIDLQSQHSPGESSSHSMPRLTW